MNNQPAPGAAAENQYNGQQRAQRSGSEANTAHWDQRSAALGSEASGQGRSYYDYYGGGPNFGWGADFAGAPKFTGEPNSGAVAACEARFRSYDPASGTYLGFDGIRHACP
jgi:hypothetical protein